MIHKFKFIPIKADLYDMILVNMKTTLLLLIVCSFYLIGCAQSSNNSLGRVKLIEVGSMADLQACDSKLDGVQAYVMSEELIYLCSKNIWSTRE